MDLISHPPPQPRTTMDFRCTSTPTLLAVALSLVFSVFYVLPPAASQTGASLSPCRNTFILTLNDLHLFYVIFLNVRPHAGFLSFDCGASTSDYLDASTGFTWQTDGTYWPSIDNWSIPVTVTPPADISYLKPLSTLRYFPNSKLSSNSSSSFDRIGQETKICYELPAVKDSFYLIRATFWIGSGLPDGYPAPRTAGTVRFRVIVDTYVGVLVNLSVPQTSVWFEEMHVKAVGSTVTLCLSAASDSSDTPFVNALELRSLTNSMRPTIMVGATGKALRMVDRVDFAALSASPPLLRYPDDPYDRLWFRSTSPAANTMSTNLTVPTSNYNDRPPPAVLQTCYVASTMQGNATLYNVTTASPGSKGVTVAGTHKYYVRMWFSELDPRVNASGLRVFTITTDGSLYFPGVDIFNKTGGKLYATYGIYTSEPWGPFMDYFDIVAEAASWSVYPPTIAGVEILQLLDDTIVTPTAFADVSAIKDVIIDLNGFKFSGDPCLPSSYSYHWVICTSDDSPRVTSISLSNYNTAPGKTIPGSLNDIDYLTTILLDGNALEGSIPSFSNLQRLQVLNLSNNKLDGFIPSSLADLPKLTYLDLQNNNLSGTIPSSLIDKQKKGLTLKYEGNPFLCTGTCESSPLTSNTGKKNQTTMTVGIVIGAVVFIILVVFLIILCKKHPPKPHNEKSLSMEKHQADSVLGKKQLIELERINARAFSFREIVTASLDFSTIIGKGGFGFVYKGTLQNGVDVAIKVLSDASQQGEREFLNEVSLLSPIHHKNLVGLVGYCIEKKLILVYEYMSNGSLFDVLFGSESPISLNWMDRLRILLNAAQGLAYLHHGCSSLIIHRDVKSSNILLNENLEGKISDFGISRRKANDGGDALTSKLVGSAGYIDPEFASTLRLSEKVDVYSFGVVLLETLCGRPPLMKDSSKETGEVQLVEWVRFFYEQCQIEEVVDFRLNGYNVESVWKVIELAMACVESHGERRPTMNEVYNELLEASNLESNSLPFGTKSSYATSAMNTEENFPESHVKAR